MATSASIAPEAIEAIGDVKAHRGYSRWGGAWIAERPGGGARVGFAVTAST